MRWFLMMLLLFGSLASACASDAVTGHIVKMLPLFLDVKGRDALSPSLYDRDAYQFYLRQHTNEISAIRFDVLWSASNATNVQLKLRLEMRGTGPDNLPRQTTFEQAVTPHFFRHWTSFTVTGDDYKKFGEMTSWRATLWAEDQMLAEQKSFLW